MFTTNTEVFTYTDSFFPRSSALNAVHFDSGNGAVAVELKSGEVYVYDGLANEDWSAFKNAWSKGRHYALVIKRRFGPGEYIGDAEEVTYSVPAADMGTVGTPKNLTYADDAKVDGEPVGNSTGPHTRVTLGVVPSAQRKHTVSFTVNGYDDVKTYEVAADNVEEAAASVRGLGDQLGLTFNVKGVYTSFE